MKIPKSDASEIRSARDVQQKQEQNRASAKSDVTSPAAVLAAKAAQTQAVVKAFTASDSVDVSLAKAIGSELNADAMLAERRKRVEDLKALIAEGKYNPSSEAVARAVGEEILLEIFSAGPEARS
jgi:anti-sigma28 factor (negative regulator of flagellin synthesis)